MTKTKTTHTPGPLEDLVTELDDFFQDIGTETFGGEYHIPKPEIESLKEKFEVFYRWKKESAKEKIKIAMISAHERYEQFSLIRGCAEQAEIRAGQAQIQAEGARRNAERMENKEYEEAERLRELLGLGSDLTRKSTAIRKARGETS